MKRNGNPFPFQFGKMSKVSQPPQMAFYHNGMDVWLFYQNELIQYSSCLEGEANTTSQSDKTSSLEGTTCACMERSEWPIAQCKSYEYLISTQLVYFSVTSNIQMTFFSNYFEGKKRILLLNSFFLQVKVPKWKKVNLFTCNWYGYLNVIWLSLRANETFMGCII